MKTESAFGLAPAAILNRGVGVAGLMETRALGKTGFRPSAVVASVEVRGMT